MLKDWKIDSSENLRFLRDFQYRYFFSAVIVLSVGLDLSGRIEPEQ